MTTDPATPNFALSLSVDGIRLLQRVADGWHLVGETALDVPDLTAALADIRASALLLDSDGLRCKLLIPNAQIKYVTLKTAQTELADVMSALEGATPYKINELVVDFDRNGGQTFIAAVARETLQEAEAFATEHGFTPHCFAAVGPPATFQTEVFFGPAKNAPRGAVMSRDTRPVMQTGVAGLRADPALDPESIAVPPTASMPPVLSITTAKLVPAGIALPAAAPVVTPPEPAATAPAIAQPATATPPPLLAADLTQAGGFATPRTVAPPPRTPDEIAIKTPEKRLSRKEKKAAAFATHQAQPARGKPRFLGLILTVILIVVMVLVALWATTVSQEDVADWFGVGTGGVIQTADIATPVALVTAPDLSVAADDTVTTPNVLPQLRETAAGRVLSPADAARIYASTGVWLRAPRLPLEPRFDSLRTTLPQLTNDGFAPAQPVMLTTTLAPDLNILAPLDPLPAGTDFARDTNGFVQATPQGVMTPQGAFVIAGAPPRKPPLRTPQTTNAPAGLVITTPPLEDTSAQAVDIAAAQPPVADETATTDPAQAGLRPKLRPDGLITPQMAAVAFADPALAAARPKSRPASLAPIVTPAPDAPNVPDIATVVATIAQAAPVNPFITATARAVAISSRPDTRPRNFARVVARARDSAAKQTARAATAQPAAPASNAAAQPSGNIPQSVARAATFDNAIRLRDVNLVGIYGRQNARRALVRLGNGRFVKVEIGSSLDGGRVTAIGDSALNYVKRGRTIALQLPSG